LFNLSINACLISSRGAAVPLRFSTGNIAMRNFVSPEGAVSVLISLALASAEKKKNPASIRTDALLE
jgi:hypothetical protein